MGKKKNRKKKGPISVPSSHSGKNVPDPKLNNAWESAELSWNFRFTRNTEEHAVFGWHHVGPDALRSIFEALRKYETRTWKDCKNDRRASHQWEDLTQLSSEAQEVLNLIPRVDQQGEVWQLRIGSCGRLFGIRRDSVFGIVFFDPEHKAYEVKKKNT